MHTYEVALWRTTLDLTLMADYVETIVASGPYSAVISLMESKRVEFAAHAAVRQCGQHHTERWSSVECRMVRSA